MMALDPEQISQLLKMIEQTREVELTCVECLDELDRYAQGMLDGMPIEGALVHVREHLEACPPCEEQFKLILETITAIAES
jgi:hypothetical protein